MFNFGAKKKKLEDFEKKLDMAIAILMEIQMAMGDRQEAMNQRNEGVKNYISTMRETFKAKGMDTSMFDQLEPLIGKKT
ncbi:MAG: hypothetical protein ACYSOO_07735 [Planctomycetota bacterium]|jgi:hypothetical protein